MSEHVVAFSDLANANLLEVGAGRPRSAGLDRFPLPILRVADVAEGRVLPSFQIDAPVPDSQDMGPKTSKPGDVVLTTKGTVGRVAIMPSDGPAFAYSPQLCYFRPIANGPLRARYLYYWFKSEEFWNQADALKGQTDMADFISLSDLNSIRMRLPSIDEQVAAIGILGALDDKIASNGQMRNLVDELLATRFAQITDESGWTELHTIGIVNDLLTKPTPGGQLRYVDISAVTQGSYDMPELTPWDSAPGRARRVLRSGDTIWSTVRPNRRSHAYVLDDDPLLVASTGLAVLTSRSGCGGGLYEATRTEEFVGYLESVAEGSAYPAVRADRFMEAPVPDLPLDCWVEFESVARPLRERAHAADQESRRLVDVRDQLLPLVMSGKVRVKDAEAIVSEVV